MSGEGQSSRRLNFRPIEPPHSPARSTVKFARPTAMHGTMLGPTTWVEDVDVGPASYAAVPLSIDELDFERLRSFGHTSVASLDDPVSCPAQVSVPDELPWTPNTDLTPFKLEPTSRTALNREWDPRSEEPELVVPDAAYSPPPHVRPSVCSSANPHFCASISASSSLMSALSTSAATPLAPSTALLHRPSTPSHTERRPRGVCSPSPSQTRRPMEDEVHPRMFSAPGAAESKLQTPETLAAYRHPDSLPSSVPRVQSRVRGLRGSFTSLTGDRRQTTLEQIDPPGETTDVCSASYNSAYLEGLLSAQRQMCIPQSPSSSGRLELQASGRIEVVSEDPIEVSVASFHSRSNDSCHLSSEHLSPTQDSDVRDATTPMERRDASVKLSSSRKLLFRRRSRGRPLSSRAGCESPDRASIEAHHAGFPHTKRAQATQGKRGAEGGLLSRLGLRRGVSVRFPGEEKSRRRRSSLDAPGMGGLRRASLDCGAAAYRSESFYAVPRKINSHSVWDQHANAEAIPSRPRADSNAHQPSWETQLLGKQVGIESTASHEPTRETQASRRSVEMVHGLDAAGGPGASSTWLRSSRRGRGAPTVQANSWRRRTSCGGPPSTTPVVSRRRSLDVCVSASATNFSACGREGTFTSTVTPSVSSEASDPCDAEPVGCATGGVCTIGRDGARARARDHSARVRVASTARDASAAGIADCADGRPSRMLSDYAGSFRRVGPSRIATHKPSGRASMGM